MGTWNAYNKKVARLTNNGYQFCIPVAFIFVRRSTQDAAKSCALAQNIAEPVPYSNKIYLRRYKIANQRNSLKRHPMTRMLIEDRNTLSVCHTHAHIEVGKMHEFGSVSNALSPTQLANLMCLNGVSKIITWCDDVPL